MKIVCQENSEIIFKTMLKTVLKILVEIGTVGKARNVRTAGTHFDLWLAEKDAR